MVHAPPPPPAGAPPVRVNLYSDTQTKPTPAMKAAMMAAEVGDEQHGSDPTVRLLCERMAALLGKQSAMFLPSGTMCNQIAILTHCRPGDEILAHETAHILTSEGGGAAALTGAQITGLKGPGGQYDLTALQAAIRPRTRYAPPQTLVEVEQTANTGGGTVWKLGMLNAIASAPGYSNVVVSTPPVDHLDLPRGLDAVFIRQNYHDLHDKFMGPADVPAFDRAVFAALKPGGVFVVLDHAAPAGSGLADTDTTHRIDEAAVKSEVEAAGFVLDGESNILANPADDRTKFVFDPAIHGHTDQFLLRFKKPG